MLKRKTLMGLRKKAKTQRRLRSQSLRSNLESSKWNASSSVSSSVLSNVSSKDRCVGDCLILVTQSLTNLMWVVTRDISSLASMKMDDPESCSSPWPRKDPQSAVLWTRWELRSALRCNTVFQSKVLSRNSLISDSNRWESPRIPTFHSQRVWSITSSVGSACNLFRVTATQMRQSVFQQADIPTMDSRRWTSDIWIIP